MASLQASVYIEDSLMENVQLSLMSLHVHQTFSIQRQVDEEILDPGLGHVHCVKQPVSRSKKSMMVSKMVSMRVSLDYR